MLLNPTSEGAPSIGPVPLFGYEYTGHSSKTKILDFLWRKPTYLPNKKFIFSMILRETYPNY